MPKPTRHVLFAQRFWPAALTGAGLRVLLACLGVGLFNAGHDDLHVLKLAQPAALALPASLTAVDPGTKFGDGLLRPLMRGVVTGLHAVHLSAPEDMVLAVGLLAIGLRLVISLMLWRVGRGYFGAVRLLHPAWLYLGLVQGALGVVIVGGVLALGQTPQMQVMVALREDSQARAVIAIKAPLEPFFLGGRPLPLAQHDRLDEVWLHRTLDTLADAHTPANRFVFFQADAERSEVMLILEGLSCLAPEVFVGGWLDRLAIKLDPARHAHRGARLVYRCGRADVAFGPKALGLRPKVARSAAP